MRSNTRLGQNDSEAVAAATRRPVNWPTLTLRLAWVACVIVVVVGSLLPGDSLPIRAFARLNISDKIQHFGAYALLAFLPAILSGPALSE